MLNLPLQDTHDHTLATSKKILCNVDTEQVYQIEKFRKNSSLNKLNYRK